MPSTPIGPSLLAMSKGDLTFPWSVPAWQERTGLSIPPWAQHDSSKPPHWGPELASKVLAFAMDFLSSITPSSSTTSYGLVSKADNFTEGRAAWDLFVNLSMEKGWGLNTLFDKTLEVEGITPWKLLKEHNVAELPNYEMTEARSCYTTLGEALFGMDAYINPSEPVTLKVVVKKFLDSAMVLTWNRWRRMLKREKNASKKYLDEVEKLWLSITTPSEKQPSAVEIRKYVKLLEKFTLILMRHGDSQSLERVDGLKQRLKDMLDAMGVDLKGQGKGLRLPSALREALRHLATTSHVRDLKILMLEYLTQFENEDADPMPELDLFDRTPLDWQEGVEDIMHLSSDDIWAKLGLPDKAIPFFNAFVDVFGTRNPWEDPEWFADRSNIVEFGPRWHQLLGIYRLVERIFEGKPMLLMDEVGLGKTLQVIGMIAVCVYFREFYNQHSRFPGAFANANFQSQPGNMADLPFILVVPVGLVNQVTSELHRYLKPHSFDIIPYLGRHSSRQNWWVEIYDKLRHSPGQRIVVSTLTALQSDYERCYPAISRKRPNEIPLLRDPSKLTTTVYGRSWLGVVVDEAHALRNIGKAYSATMMLAIVSKTFVAMTATPVMTRPLDLWNLGRCLRMKAFDIDADGDALEMQRGLTAALRRDRRSRVESSEGSIVIRSLSKGERFNMDGDHMEAMSYWMEQIRERYRGHVIRRTVTSKDNKGEQIIGLEPYQEHKLVLQLYDYEMKYLDLLASEIAEDCVGGGAIFASGKDFYLAIRRALTHPLCQSDGELPKTLSEWDRIKSKKLEVLVQLLHHHLAVDSAVPMRIKDNLLFPNPPPPCVGIPSSNPVSSNAETTPQDPSMLANHILSPSDQTSPSVTANPCPTTPASSSSVPLDTSSKPTDVMVGNPTSPDKIIVFSNFPGNNELLKILLDMSGISYEEIHGYMSPSQRTAAIKRFRDAGFNGPRVLILSQVGMTGLNLHCASVLIMLDTLWSAQDDRQLIGRIWRQPQKKTVHVYRLIADRTSDIFLNNISFDKAAMHLAFTNSSPELCNIFSNDEMDSSPTTEDNVGEGMKGASGSGDVRKQKKSVKRSTVKKLSKGKGKLPPSGADRDNSPLVDAGPSDTLVSTSLGYEVAKSHPKPKAQKKSKSAEMATPSPVVEPPASESSLPPTIPNRTLGESSQTPVLPSSPTSRAGMPMADQDQQMATHPNTPERTLSITPASPPPPPLNDYANETQLEGMGGDPFRDDFDIGPPLDADWQDEGTEQGSSSSLKRNERSPSKDQRPQKRALRVNSPSEYWRSGVGGTSGGGFSALPKIQYKKDGKGGKKGLSQPK